MTSHLHLIIGSKGNSLSDIMRDLKRHSSEKLHIAIAKNAKESRREWLLEMFRSEGEKHKNKFQLLQPESHPIALVTAKLAHQKLEYIHNNPVEAGFVKYSNTWLYSSAVDYNGGKGLFIYYFAGSNDYVIGYFTIDALILLLVWLLLLVPSFWVFGSIFARFRCGLQSELDEAICEVFLNSPPRHAAALSLCCMSELG